LRSVKRIGRWPHSKLQAIIKAVCWQANTSCRVLALQALQRRRVLKAPSNAFEAFAIHERVSLANKRSPWLRNVLAAEGKQVAN
jgi:hypothetical protein